MWIPFLYHRWKFLWTVSWEFRKCTWFVFFLFVFSWITVLHCLSSMSLQVFFHRFYPFGGCYSIWYKWKSYPFTFNLAGSLFVVDSWVFFFFNSARLFVPFSLKVYTCAGKYCIHWPHGTIHLKCIWSDLIHTDIMKCRLGLDFIIQKM